MNKLLSHPAAKPLLLALALLPFAHLLWGAVANTLGANPAEALIRGTGDWVLRFLCLTLAVTPLREAFGWTSLARLRRMRASPVRPKASRSGVTASVMHSRRSTQSPVPRISASAGLAPRPSVAAPQTRCASGSSASAIQMGLAARCIRARFTRTRTLAGAAGALLAPRISSCA